MTPRLRYSSPPSVGTAYLRALADRRPRRLAPDSGAPVIEAEAAGLRADPARVAAYRRACGLKDDGFLPLSYPHIMSAGVHMGMLLHQDFPVKMVGLVHLANDIELFRPIDVDAVLELECRLSTGRSKPRGDEFQMVTEALVDGELAWRETMNFLAPATRKEPRRPAPEAPELPELIQEWEVPADIGRRYARVSGDWNPIHLAAPLARPFGFPGAIAHGMWSLALCLGGLAQDAPASGARLEVRFLKPLVLPSRVALHAEAPDEAGTRGFWLVSGADGMPHLKGSWNPGRD